MPNTTTPQSQSRTLHSSVDLLNRMEIGGWAFEPDFLENRVAILISVNDQIVGKTIANMYRADLEHANIGDGRHAFHFVFPVALSPNKNYAIAIKRESDGQPLHYSQTMLRAEGITFGEYTPEAVASGSLQDPPIVPPSVPQADPASNATPENRSIKPKDTIASRRSIQVTPKSVSKQNEHNQVFDSDFYTSAYVIAREEMAAGLAHNALDHYLKFGAARGYLPSADAIRPLHAAAYPSTAGGYWTDLPNALDLVQGKIDTGQITRIQAELFRSWIQDGYVILEQAIADDIIDRALLDFEKGYNGELEGLRFECTAFSGGFDPIPWQPEIKEYASKALDIHVFSRKIRDLIFADPITHFLGLLFDSRTIATQTLGFLRGSAQEGHQDSAYVAYTLPRQFAASWVALEDVTIGAGELFYYPGSHKFDDFFYEGKYKSFHEAKRLHRDTMDGGAILRHVKSLEKRVLTQNLDKKPLVARKGDVLIWHAELVHGGSQISRAFTRKSIVTHYCPTYSYPLYGEQGAVKLHTHNGHRFMSSHHPTMVPLE